MRIPNALNAIIELSKLTSYVLNKAHDRGEHKAIMFEKELGITAALAPVLQAWLLDAVQHNDAVQGELNEYGQRYVVDFTVPGIRGEVTIRSAWIIEMTVGFPRLVTCYITKVVNNDKSN